MREQISSNFAPQALLFTTLVSLAPNPFSWNPIDRSSCTKKAPTEPHSLPIPRIPRGPSPAYPISRKTTSQSGCRRLALARRLRRGTDTPIQQSGDGEVAPVATMCILEPSKMSGRGMEEKCLGNLRRWHEGRLARTFLRIPWPPGRTWAYLDMLLVKFAKGECKRRRTIGGSPM